VTARPMGQCHAGEPTPKLHRRTGSRIVATLARQLRCCE
jgi:hypothetical protein